MSLHIWHHQGPCKPSSSPSSPLTLTGAELPQAKKKKSLAFMHAGSLWPCPTLCDPVDCGLSGFSVREGVLQARILECTGQDWLSYPSRAQYFLPPQPPTPLRTWCGQKPCDQSSCTTSTPGPRRGKPKPSRAASGADASGRPHAEVEIKPQLKPRGGVAEEEDPKPPHQL